MTKDELRVHFNLKSCANPRHTFEFGRFMGEWIWAEDCWSQIVDDKLQTLLFAIHTTERVDGLKIISFTAWRLKIMMGLGK